MRKTPIGGWSQIETDKALRLLERAHGEIALLEVLLGNSSNGPLVKKIASFLTKHGVLGINGKPLRKDGCD